MDYVTLIDGNGIVMANLPSGSSRPISKGIRYPWGVGQYPGTDKETALTNVKVDLDYFRSRNCFKVESEVEKVASDVVEKVKEVIKPKVAKAKGRTKKSLIKKIIGGK